MIELYQLKQFLAVVEHETVSKAADALNMTQPALSRSLQNLEYELQLPLFDRGKNKITLNDSGRMAAEEARALLAAADGMKSRLQDYYRQNHSPRQTGKDSDIFSGNLPLEKFDFTLSC